MAFRYWHTYNPHNNERNSHSPHPHPNDGYSGISGQAFTIVAPATMVRLDHISWYWRTRNYLIHRHEVLLKFSSKVTYPQLTMRISGFDSKKSTCTLIFILMHHIISIDISQILTFGKVPMPCHVPYLCLHSSPCERYESEDLILNPIFAVYHQ